MTWKRLAFIIAKNIIKFIIKFVWYKIIIESRIRLKWLKQHISALAIGFKSHADYMQFLLDVKKVEY